MSANTGIREVRGGTRARGCDDAHTGRGAPLVSASMTPDRSRYLLNSSFFVSGLCDAREVRVSLRPTGQHAQLRPHLESRAVQKAGGHEERLFCLLQLFCCRAARGCFCPPR